MPVLDATFLADLWRAPSRMRRVADVLVADASSRHERIVVPFPAAIEFAYGSMDAPAAFRVLEASYDVVAMDREDAVEAARLGRRVAGRNPGWHDVEIGAMALRRGMFVATRNVGHFRVLGCKVWDYASSAPPPA